MKLPTTRRRAALLAVLLACQALSACVVVPVPYHRRPFVVVEPGYDGPPGGYRGYGRDHR